MVKDMKIAVCDDSPIDREIITMMLLDYAAQKSVHFDIEEYDSGVNLIYDIEEGRSFDMLFLDIYMDEILGIEAAHKLRKDIHYEGNIVFLTATSEFAVDSYEVDASGYLVKPLSYEKVFAMMDKILLSYKAETYSIRKHSGLLRLPVDEILFIDSDNNKCVIHRKDGRTFTVYKKLDEIQDELPSSHFLRCHQSYLVNMDYIQRADKEFELVTGDIISIRQRDLKNIRSIYLDYVSRHSK
jgi:two-component system response regulator LytT